MNFITKYKITIIGIIVGAIGGYAYYHFVGCASNACTITSSPINSMAYGALMGGLLFTNFKKENSNNKNSENEKQ